MNNLEDTEFMFDITKLLSLNAEYTNNLQYKVMNSIEERTPGNFDTENPNVRIPTSKTEAEKNV